ncbi:carbohydrate kinase family protein [Candidatus Saccharibacteria bacterium]|nr:carbohydrate kinase family protein [Candidatus Saccharibacteria bacterium]MCR5700174.1 carbohydrate kinase family protein [Candidatus Saccharibacteria bacterium]
MARVVSLGSALQDVYMIDHDDLAPTEIGGEAIFGKVLVGGKVDIDRISYEVGGGGVNSAITFARHGHEVILMANIARDSAGSAVTRILAREGIDDSYLGFLERKTTGTSVVLLDSKSGERTILTCRGASEQFGNFAESDLDLIQPDWLYVTTLRGDMETLERFFKKAASMGVRIMFNPGVRELEQVKHLTKLLRYVDVLNVNKHEAAQIVPGATLTELLYRLQNYVDTVIITDGPMGGIASNGKEIYRFGIYEDKKVRDATGAGDAFGSGFLAALAAGKSFRSALIFASANSTAVVSKLGANRGILSGSEKLHPMPIQKI